MNGHNHYQRVNEAGEIILGFSDAFEQPQDGDILVLEDGPRHHHEAFPETYVNERGQYRFRLVDGQQVAKTQEELDAEWSQRPPDPPTVQQQLDELTLALADIYAGGM